MAEPMSDRLVADAPFWRASQYEAAERLENDLRAIANGAPSWLYDDSGLGALIDKLNEARHKYEMKRRHTFVPGQGGAVLPTDQCSRCRETWQNHLGL